MRLLCSPHGKSLARSPNLKRHPQIDKVEHQEKMKPNLWSG